jgi:diguanylate cyclase (GGDEF)-like protein/PAS domain S-box-containing protein
VGRILDAVMGTATLDRIRDAYLVFDEGLRLIDATDAAADLYGYAPDEMIGRHLQEFRAPRFAEHLSAEYRGPQGRCRTITTEHLRRDGTVIPVVVRAIEVAYESGTVVLVEVSDMRQTEAAEEFLLRSHARLTTIAATIPGVLYEYEVDPAGGGQYVYVGPGCEDLLGISESVLMEGKDPVWDLVHPDDLPRVLAADEAADDVSKTFEVDFRAVHPSGAVRWIHMTSRMLPTRAGRPDTWCGLMLDISERKQVEEELRRRDGELARLNAELMRQASTDALTGLSNRRHFYNALDRCIVASESTGAPLSIASFDLDGLKRVNDTYGHARGDHSLVGFAALLNDYREGDSVAGRLGGDEFSIVLPGLDAAAAAGLAKSIVESARTNPMLASLGVTASGGVAQHRAGELADDVMHRADSEVYSAKRLGGDSAHVG